MSDQQHNAKQITAENAAARTTGVEPPLGRRAYEAPKIVEDVALTVNLGTCTITG
jgi:hypothetical protein